jgi:hypothetical protein
MLSEKKIRLYPLFSSDIESTYGGSGLGRDEQLLAFYLAYKRGIKGYLIDQFKKQFLKEAETKKEKLIKEYFSIHSSISLPSSLRRKTLTIFKQEQNKVMNEIKKIIF